MTIPHYLHDTAVFTLGFVVGVIGLAVFLIVLNRHSE